MERKPGIVDVHAHIFPDELAERAVKRLIGNSGETAFTDGTASGLESSMRSGGIAWSVTQPVSTKVLFGTDSPWADQTAEVKLMRATGLTEAELRAVCFDNAARLLGLPGSGFNSCFL